MIEFDTSSGSTYLWDKENSRIKRTASAFDHPSTKYRNEWTGVIGDGFVEVGYNAVFTLEQDRPFRVTTEVIRIREVKNEPAK